MNMWLRIHQLANMDHLGYIPEFFTLADPRPVAEQIAENYCDGWRAQSDLTLPEGASLDEPSSLKLQYPGDPPLEPLWYSIMRDELVVVYPYGYTAIFQPDLTFEASRLD